MLTELFRRKFFTINTLLTGNKELCMPHSMMIDVNHSMSF